MPKNVTNEASKFLNFDDEESENAVEPNPVVEDVLNESREVEKRSSMENVQKPRIVNLDYMKPCESQRAPIHVEPTESEALVEWKYDDTRPAVNTEDDDCAIVEGGLTQMKIVPKSTEHVFAFNSFDEKVKFTSFTPS